MSTAWPILDEKADDDTWQSHLARIEQALVEAKRVSNGLDDTAGVDRPVQPGQ
jgi:hypothetical protein